MKYLMMFRGLLASNTMHLSRQVTRLLFAAAMRIYLNGPKKYGFFTSTLIALSRLYVGVH